MGLRERIIQRAAPRIEEWTGFTVRDAEDVRLMETEYAEARGLADNAEDLALLVTEQLPDAPGGMSPERRRQIARKSQIALLRDPLAGAEADMKANFAFGRGIGRPNAVEEDVQKVIDRAWKDPVNRRKLTGFEAQRHRSNELLTQANLFPAIFEKNGRVRIAFRDPFLVRNIVVHEQDDELPMYYGIAQHQRKYNFELDMWEAIPPEQIENGREKIRYMKHWRNVTIAEQNDGLTDDQTNRPPDSKITPGLVEHFRINRVGQTQWGVPPWARVLRYFSAMGQFTEARVNMAQAAASIIATRTLKGGRKQMMKSATNVLKQTGDMAAARFARRNEAPNPASPTTEPTEAAAPPPAGSTWLQNESDTLQATSLNSGAAGAIQDGQVIRAPIAAQSQIGQHWLGDASATNMATATTLELPALMAIGAWQETFEEMFRWFVNRAIDAAFHAGELGDSMFPDSDDPRPNADLVYEEDQEEMEKRSGLDLSYSFEMPYPGRRNLPDVMGVVNSVAQAYDPGGTNEPLRKSLLEFLFSQGLQSEDPARIVEGILEADQAARDKAEQQQAEYDRAQAEAAAAAGQPAPPPGQAAPPAPAAKPATNTPNDQKSQNGEARKRTPPPREMGGSAPVRESIDDRYGAQVEDALVTQVDESFGELLDDPTVLLKPPPKEN